MGWKISIFHRVLFNIDNINPSLVGEAWLVISGQCESSRRNESFTSSWRFVDPAGWLLPIHMSLGVLKMSGFSSSSRLRKFFHDISVCPSNVVASS
jgi:hypothetical protein